MSRGTFESGQARDAASCAALRRIGSRKFPAEARKSALRPSGVVAVVVVVDVAAAMENYRNQIRRAAARSLAEKRAPDIGGGGRTLGKIKKTLHAGGLASLFKRVEIVHGEVVPENTGKFLLRNSASLIRGNLLS